MLFKSDVPMSHRVAFFLAGMVTIGPFQRMVRGVGLEALDFLPVVIGWGLVVYQWRQRKTLRWQVRNAAGYGHNTPFDWVQSGIDRVPDSIYLLLAMLAAFAVYWAFSRG
jgi:uncharacterized membrane protein YhfC